ncbi:hypothetical protein L1274_004456 [Duganella sp. HSC-15S17]|uniref:Transposase IS66 C-terminal domain-containing protein n=1 Tax=Duganella violaceipulchra TaxID=2849652 RepID=A0ABT1GR72_9BURK|nr:hypothetical protein [Duganella violaceicalia]
MRNVSAAAEKDPNSTAGRVRIKLPFALFLLCAAVHNKKNWLFTGSERAGRRAAAIQSLFATAKLNGLDPLRWLSSVLERLPTCPNSQLDTLLPFPNSIPR